MLLRVVEVSVIMPAYNAAAFIPESIESVLRQTYTNWELLVVNDGSVDDTESIALAFCKKDQRIKYFWQENGKAGKARNHALKHAAGKYIAFLDADDVWLPQKLEIQLNQIEENKVDLVFSDAFAFTDANTDHLGVLHSGKGFFNLKNGIEDFLALNRIPTLTVLAKANIIQQVKGFTEDRKIPQAEDYHLWLKLLMSDYSFFGADAVLGGYRIHSSASSHGDKLVVSYVIEAFEDLKKNHKPYKSLLNIYQKKWFSRYHASSNNWSKKDYKALIIKNCKYVEKGYLIFLFRSMYFFGGLHITRRIMNKLVNA